MKLKSQVLAMVMVALSASIASAEAFASVPSECEVPKRPNVFPLKTIKLTTAALVKNDPAHCSLLDAFQIVNDGNNLGKTNKCPAVTIGSPAQIVVIDAGGRTFLPTEEIFLGSNTAFLKNATFDAKRKTRVFHVATDDATLMLDRVVIVGAKTSGSGGAVLVEQGAALSLDNSILQDNWALTDGGGVAFQSYGGLTVRNTLFKWNIAEASGGGLSVTGAGRADIYESRIFENVTVGAGGGLHVAGEASVNLRASYVEKNRSHDGPGAGIHSAAQLALTCTRLFENKTYSGDGGGLYIQPASGKVTADYTSIDSNYAGLLKPGRGGGVFVGDDFIATRSSIARNTARGDGGGLYIDDGAADDPVHLENLTISANNANGGRGGAMWITGKNARVGLEDLDTDNTLLGAEHSFHMFHTTIVDNAAVIDYSGVASFDEILFLNNVVSHHGGLRGCAGYVERLLPGRLNDPEPQNTFNVQWPGTSCGTDIPRVYGGAPAHDGYLFGQAYSETIVGNPGDIYVCAWTQFQDQFGMKGECELGAVRDGPPPAVTDPPAPN